MRDRANAFFDRLVAKPRAEHYAYLFIAGISAPYHFTAQRARAKRAARTAARRNQ